MANIELFDGTIKTVYGKVLGKALKELERHQHVRVTPEPGGIDMDGFNLVKALEAEAFNPARQQVDMGELIEMADLSPIGRRKNTETIVLIEEDGYFEGLNWAFGGYVPHNGKDYVILSMARVQDKAHLFDLFAHELGHMYGAASEGRTNTEENLGSHCTNRLCVMQQELTVEGSAAQARKRLRLRAETYCSQCRKELSGELRR